MRPFDSARSGTVLGEGAAVFVLEELDSARRRGARIMGELLGFASGFDKDLSGAGLAAIIRRALTEAAVTTADIDHVNCAAGGSVRLDPFEARAIADVFGRDFPVVSVRGQIGNTGAAAGLVELAASVLALQAGTVPGTLNADAVDAACPVGVSPRVRPVQRPCAVKVSYTDMGQCAVAVIRRWGE